MIKKNLKGNDDEEEALVTTHLEKDFIGKE